MKNLLKSSLSEHIRSKFIFLNTVPEISSNNEQNTEAIVGREKITQLQETPALQEYDNAIGEESSLNNEVEWDGESITEEPLEEIDAGIKSEEISKTSLKTELENRNYISGLKNNYVAEGKEFTYKDEKGIERSMNLDKAIVESFDQLNDFIESNDITEELFEKACFANGLNNKDVQVLQSLRKNGRISGKASNKDVGELQIILGKLNLTNGMGVDGKPDEKFGSGTVKDTESLTMILKPSILSSLEWNNFRDTIMPITNGTLQRFWWGINNIVETGEYNPKKNDPMRLFDETIVAQGGPDYKRGGNKVYSVEFLAGMPDDVLARVANSEKSKEIILHNKKNRIECEERWNKFQAENSQYFDNNLIAEK